MEMHGQAYERASVRRNYEKVFRDTSNAAHECKVAIDNLEEYFEDKFRAFDGKTEKMTNCENSVYDKNSMMDNVDFSYVTMANWNTLPDSIVATDTIVHFKKALRTVHFEAALTFNRHC